MASGWFLFRSFRFLYTMAYSKFRCFYGMIYAKCEHKAQFLPRLIPHNYRMSLNGDYRKCGSAPQVEHIEFSGNLRFHVYIRNENVPFNCLTQTDSFNCQVSHLFTLFFRCTSNMRCSRPTRRMLNAFPNNPFACIGCDFLIQSIEQNPSNSTHQVDKK